MFECFHGAFLSFVLSHGSSMGDDHVLERALTYANEISALSGRGVGARSYPTLREQALVRDHG
jgi:hypothetical protein